MANTLKFGNGEWYGKKDTILAYNDENNNYKPLPFSFDRDSSATRVNKEGLIETVGSGEPRVDFLNDSKGALLLEPSRTNNLLQSNQFDTTWTLSASIDLTSGQNGVGGSNNAWLLKRNSTGSRYIQQSLSLSSSQYSYSVYLKAESRNWALIWCYDGSNGTEAYFDLENGVVGNTSGSNFDNATIENVGNGWYRCTLIYTSATTLVRIYPANTNGNVSIGTDNGIYIQYSQVEQGSYATSYIPTQGGIATRVQDVCYNNNLGNVIGQTEGTFYIETIPLASTTSFTERIIQFEASGSDFITFQRYGNSNLTFYGTDGSNSWTIQGLNLFLGGETIKIAGAYKDNDIALYVNGVQIGTNTSANAPQVDRMWFANNASGSLAYSGSHKEVKFYNTRLSNTELQALTQI